MKETALLYKLIVGHVSSGPSLPFTQETRSHCRGHPSYTSSLRHVPTRPLHPPPGWQRHPNRSAARVCPLASLRGFVVVVVVVETRDLDVVGD